MLQASLCTTVGAPTVIYHMANGMYGAIIVDPAKGWVPAQEYVLV